MTHELMSTKRQWSLSSDLRDYQQSIEFELGRQGALSMTIKLYRTIKALTELLAVGLCIYAAANGVALELAMGGALSVVVGVEGLETLVAARGQSALVTEDQLEERIPDDQEDNS